MKRFILSAFSVVLATSAIAPAAQALPKLDSEFSLQTLRLQEFDARNKSEESEKPYYYPEASSDDYYPAEADSSQSADANTWEEQESAWEAPANEEEAAAPALSITQRRHQELDRDL